MPLWLRDRQTDRQRQKHSVVEGWAGGIEGTERQTKRKRDSRERERDRGGEGGGDRERETEREMETERARGVRSMLD